MSCPTVRKTSRQRCRPTPGWPLVEAPEEAGLAGLGVSSFVSPGREPQRADLAQGLAKLHRSRDLPFPTAPGRE